MTGHNLLQKLSYDFKPYRLLRNKTSFKKRINKKRDFGSLNRQTDQKIDKLTDILAVHRVKQDDYRHVFT